MARAITEEAFLGDVANHAMTVLMDNGIYRHLRFASTNEHSWNQWFQIVTWPGFLAFSGDMGCFVFSRLTDMFEFFRTRPGSEPSKLYINLSYWAEKLEAVDRCGPNSGEKQYSSSKFEHLVAEHVAGWITESNLGEDDQAELRELIKRDVLQFSDEGGDEAHRALRDFSCEIGDETFEFCDTWEWDLQEYTFRFVWCCYAVAWAIQQYDARPQNLAVAT